jgi:hypothetical protein
MFILMVVLSVAGIALLLAGPLVARAVVGSRWDPTPIGRILRGVGVILLIAALFVRPHNPSTGAIPSAPDQPAAKPE